MKHAYIVLAFDGSAWSVHPHPVFMGEVAYDMPNSQQGIPTDPDFNCREFTSANEVAVAIGDYMRQAPDPVAPGSFHVVERCSFPAPFRYQTNKL